MSEPRSYSELRAFSVDFAPPPPPYYPPTGLIVQRGSAGSGESYPSTGASSFSVAIVYFSVVAPRLRNSQLGRRSIIEEQRKKSRSYTKIRLTHGGSRHISVIREGGYTQQIR